MTTVWGPHTSIKLRMDYFSVYQHLKEKENAELIGKSSNTVCGAAHLHLHLEPQIWLSDTVRSAISKQTHYHHKGSRTRSYDLGPDIKKETLQKHMRPASHEDTPYTKHIQWCAWCVLCNLQGTKNNALNNTCIWWHVFAVWSDLVDDVSDFPHVFLTLIINHG